MTAQLELAPDPPDPAFPVCPFCGAAQDLDMRADNGVDWNPCCLEAREAVAKLGWEEVFGFELEETLSEWLDEEVREVVLESDDGDSRARFALELFDYDGEKGWRDEVFAKVAEHHRHLDPPVSWKYGIAVRNGPSVVGVVVVGRPVAHVLQQRGYLEITRCCVFGDYALRHNAASMLYGAACREAKRRGYKKVVTYTLPEEPGSSLRAAGFQETGRTRGGSWNRRGRPRKDKHPTCRKTRWERVL